MNGSQFVGERVGPVVANGQLAAEVQDLVEVVDDATAADQFDALQLVVRSRRFRQGRSSSDRAAG